MLREGKGGAAVILRGLGVEIKAVRSAMEAILGRNEPIIIRQLVPTARVKKVIELSFEEARSMGAEEMGTEHLLLGLLIEGDGLGAHVLQDLGAGLDNVRDQLSRRPPSGVPVRPVHDDQQLAAGLPDDAELALSIRSSAAPGRWPPSGPSARHRASPPGARRARVRQSQRHLGPPRANSVGDPHEPR
ncbi:MAG: hypothetical protein M3019_02990 [Candidatus Dormibacteraeota bacterium]|nr:hypothetical protein [Candidatus Dormibacteraeota bacterium]